MTDTIDDHLDEFFARPAPVRASAQPTRSARPARPAPDVPGGSGRSARPVPPSPTRWRATGRPRRSTRTVPSRPAPLDRAGRVGTGPVRSAPPAGGEVNRNATRATRATPATRSTSSGTGDRTRRSRPAPRPAVALDGAAARRRTLRRLAWLVAVLVAVAAGIGAKMATIQVAQRDRWQAWGLDQRDGWREIPAGRGAIYDRTGQPLALSVVRPDVVADPANVLDAAATARTLAPLLDRPVAELEAELSRDGNYALLATAVEPEVAARIEQLRDDEDERSRTEGEAVRTLEGVVLKDRFVRFYPGGDLATAVVGRTVAGGGVDEQGREGVSGIEAQFDDALTGEPGRLQYEHDPSGRTIAGGTQTIDPARPGTDVFLTIDQSLQYEAERAIADQVEATGATGGMVLMMRPSTGEILAMTSVALDDEGNAVNTRDNKPVTAVFEPGSVNKVITVAGALEEGLVEPDTVLEVPDHLTIYDKTFSDHDPHPVRAWSVTDILVTSSNIGTIKLAQALGREDVDRYLRDFGLGETTGLGFPNEENGIMLPLEDWSGTSIGAIPIGQGIAVTALQMLSAYNAIANDGVYVAPRLVAATDAGGGRVEAPAAARRRVVSADTARAVQEMLEKVVTEGTGKRARVPDYPAAGKTGTARIPQGIDPSDGYRGADGRYHYQSTFLGFVSGADLSILVTLEDPQTSTYGGEVAAPVFAELAAIALLRSQTPPPALLERSAADVPELSATAKVESDEDAGPPTSAAAG